MRIAVYQANPTVGAFVANRDAFLDALQYARAQSADLLLAPPGALTGAPLEGLVGYQTFLDRRRRERLTFHRQAVALGFRPASAAVGGEGDDRPEVPDDTLWLSTASGVAAVPPPGLRLAATARPWRLGHAAARSGLLAAHCREKKRGWIEANLAGGQDETIFAGESLAFDAAGHPLARAARCRADRFVLDTAHPLAAMASDDPDELDGLREALVAALRDYFDKNGLDGALLGLSGGIDSALAAALAVEALGPGRVHGLTLPGPFTSEATLSDALRLAGNLGIDCGRVAIDAIAQAADAALAPVWGGAVAGGTLPHQNLQARSRAMVLMGLANRRGWAVLNTSNATESAMGYGTLYGDLIGALSPLREVNKLQVWALSRRINETAGREVIPVSTIARVPSAELAPGQEDRQSLPDYPVLDPLLERFFTCGEGVEALAAAGHSRAAAERALSLYGRMEFKRRQAIPGPRVRGRTYSLGGEGGVVWSFSGTWRIAASDGKDGEPEVEAFLASAPAWDVARWPMTAAPR